MAIRVALNHKTHYLYDRQVKLGPQIIRLRPAPHVRVPILSYSLTIEPDKHFINWQQDPYGNYLARLVFPDSTDRLLIDVNLIAEMAPFNPFDFFLEPSAEKYPFKYDSELERDLRPFLETEDSGPELTAFVRSVPTGCERTIDFLVDLNRRLSTRIGYVIRMEPGVQSCEQTLLSGTGSCRDSAWLLVQILRNLGLAARFVSGYLIQLTPDIKPLEGPVGPSADFTDLHAWAEVYLPGAGWIGFDPTSGMLAGEGHIPLACTPSPVSAAPVSGALEWCNTDFRHHMAVTRLAETPRITRPYSDEQWASIDALGEKVDEDLRELDVRLTMGGEPTFVAMDEADAQEWNSEAAGERKRRRSVELLLKMRDRFASGALLHFGQGKWYPGEQLPRWALGCYWRSDGVAIWENQALIADERRDYSFGTEQAQHFMRTLTRRLGVSPASIEPAREDVLYYVWRERRLPVNVDPLQSRVKDAVEREELARVFENDPGAVVGYVLPLRRVPAGNGRVRWTSQPWFVRSKHLFLVPGDSPLGYRLPLDSLPWTKPEDVEWSYDADPFRAREELPSAPARRMDLFEAELEDPPVVTHEAKAPKPGEPAPWTARPAVCIQPRGGRLFVFMPPVQYLADYLNLIAAVEDTCAYLGMPVMVEGYTPPSDPRIGVFKITPDPGVMEVNIQPARSWRELTVNTSEVYRLARECRLTAEKFMMDGRQTGTGGGNHIVLGAASAEDSPFLRRPDLLRSIITYWQNHPSLSYFFSGLFIGPTSQHPRVDEARDDSLYELEIAFRQVPDASNGAIAPWLVDRLFRNLLIDASGNTHRAEICIDKLYPPDAASPRLGLVELRAFEMPPHARMSVTQQLAVRALIAMMWRAPRNPVLVHWQTALHDRFLLPHFIQADWHDVLKDLRSAGYEFEDAWFAAQYDFRFPVIGSVTVEGIRLELRHALEPWHVLGEEASTSGATVRNVDSSVERLQVKVSGMTESRHIVLCEGRRIPLGPTGAIGEFVGGVRYRAWQPPSCLHPTIPVHTPLVFDVVDTWSGLSVGGCTYHVSHPGGRANEKLPVNASEAESRRLARFSGNGHTSGPIRIPPAEYNPDFPLTLDLRRPVRE
jgi:uncharacterized protein (DUF2126 family)/transglutaminase-like putative cysteine protease